MPTPASNRPSPGTLFAAAILVAILIATIGLPLVGIALQLSAPNPTPDARPETSPWSWGAVAETFLYTTLIGGLATTIALPGAWLMRRRSALAGALLGLPLLMPTYLAYAGWGLLRGPGSSLGDLLGRAPPWVSTSFDRSLAVVGLSLWAWPIAAFVIGAAARRIPAHLLDALDLEPGPAWRKTRVVVGMLFTSIVGSIALIALAMAGSAVPLHLAQADTYAVHLWRFMLTNADPASVWHASWPLFLLAVIGALAVFRAVSRERPPIADEGDTPHRPIARSATLVAGGVWFLAVIAPGLLFAAHIRHWSPVGESALVKFWRFNSSAVVTSGLVAAAVGTLVAAVALATFSIRSARARGIQARVASCSLVVFLAGAIIPGILLGNATLGFWNAPFLPRAAGDSLWPVVLAHTARFGFLGALAGWWLGSLETPDERGARLMLAGDSLRAWAALCLRPHIGVVVGIALAGAALSLHEIESTVILQPPGPTSLAQYMLDKLHYNRNEDLCAAGVNLFAVGLAVALASGFLIARTRLPRRQ